MSIRYIDRQKELLPVIRHLETTDQIAVDLEFDRNRYRYGFNLCLIQIFDGEDCHLVDPLSDDIRTQDLFPVFEDPDIEKVAFAFQEDHRLLHYIGCKPKNIYDLRIASQLLNHPPASLTNIIEDLLDVHMGKSSQDSNWFKRPLKKNQIVYAAKDVLHLFDLKKSLLKSVNGSEILDWIEEENRNWDHVSYDGSDINNYIKEKDKKDLSEVEWHVFKALMNYREEIAKSSNRPSYQIFSKKLIYKIVENPEAVKNWTDEKGIFRRIKNRRYQSILQKIISEAEQEAESLGLSQSKPARKSPSSEEMKKIHQRKQKIQKAKEEFFIPIKEKISDDYGEEVSTFLFSNRTVAEIVTGSNGSLETYKQKLLDRYASDLNLDKNKFIG